MRSDRRKPVAIVGGGASGSILAAQLARRGIESVVIEGSGRAGRGVAYSTREPAHLLNVRAEGMSAWADDPKHFARHFEAAAGDARGFAQRRFFGGYLRNLLDAAVESGATRIVEATAIGATTDEGGWRVGLDDGSSIEAAAVVLCTGNQEPGALRAFAGCGNRFIANPWGEAAQEAVRDLAESGGDALLVGTGLTMVDLVLSLEAAGHQGRIIALSRRGLIPRTHADAAPAPVDAGDVPHGSPRALLHWLRGQSAKVGWRAAVDGLRPRTQSLWQSFPVDQQERFLRHGRPWWDVHRHRIAPEVGGTVARLIAEDRLEIVAGRVLSADAANDGITVEYRRRGRPSNSRVTVAYAFNCTGPLQSIERTRDPLLRSLLDAGQAQPDQLGIGLEVDDHCRAGHRLWAMGPLTKGRYWEIIAVPDIREQAAAVAGDVAQEVQA